MSGFCAEVDDDLEILTLSGRDPLSATVLAHACTVGDGAARDGPKL